MESVTGYLATTYVDDLEGTSCVVHISSQFDVTRPTDAVAAAARFEAIYLAMFDGYPGTSPAWLAGYSVKKRGRLLRGFQHQVVSVSKLVGLPAGADREVE